ncbi:hypothetical protein Rhopal_004936-T1 [Rhodotorula paludigena]|uniref:Ribosome assembly protein 3 n=1 Tax=Rhodotorula paludigena TaxID=86838 RepID=A0AAV5GH51_9BASI|nr:hypothetical protein Rhopal_004936-T1 [Rhodotorula paludigena]
MLLPPLCHLPPLAKCFVVLRTTRYGAQQHAPTWNTSGGANEGGKGRPDPKRRDRDDSDDSREEGDEQATSNESDADKSFSPSKRRSSSRVPAGAKKRKGTPSSKEAKAKKEDKGKKRATRSTSISGKVSVAADLESDREGKEDDTNAGASTSKMPFDLTSSSSSKMPAGHKRWTRPSVPPIGGEKRYTEDDLQTRIKQEVADALAAANRAVSFEGFNVGVDLFSEFYRSVTTMGKRLAAIAQDEQSGKAIDEVVEQHVHDLVAAFEINLEVWTGKTNESPDMASVVDAAMRRANGAQLEEGDKDGGAMGGA